MIAAASEPMFLSHQQNYNVASYSMNIIADCMLVIKRCTCVRAVYLARTGTRTLMMKESATRPTISKVESDNFHFFG